ncbi:MAG: hypothetical protein HUU15_10160 [Candidatus Brocadiae bacterium]|nr:hypothetical protein [Candidatus Brocadiia bacterium]
MGKFIVVLAVLLGAFAPALISAAPGNPMAELGREEIKFQGMYNQLNDWYCSAGGGPRAVTSGGNGINFDSLMRSLNARREQAYRRRGRSVPEPFRYECEGQEPE